MTKQRKERELLSLIALSLAFLFVQCNTAFAEPGDEHTLVITHADTSWNREMSAKPGIDRLIEYFTAHGHPILALKYEGAQSYPSESPHQQSEKSSDGHFQTVINSDRVTIVGGYVGACLSCAIASTIKNYSGTKPLEIYIPLFATYGGRQGWMRFVPENANTAFTFWHRTKLLKSTDLAQMAELLQWKLKEAYAVQIILNGKPLHSNGVESKPHQSVRVNLWSDVGTYFRSAFPASAQPTKEFIAKTRLETLHAKTSIGTSFAWCAEALKALR